MAQIFVSYAAEDAAIARDVAAALRNTRNDVWIAPDSIPPGQAYNEAIVAGIRASDALCVLVSPHSNASKHVMREVGLAEDQGKLVVPIRIVAVEPSDALAYYLSIRQWVEWHRDGAKALAPVIELLSAKAAPKDAEPARPAVLEVRRPNPSHRGEVSICVNGRIIGTLAAEDSARWYVDAGRPSLTIQYSFFETKPFELEIEAGRTYRLDVIEHPKYFEWKVVE